jgi:hypothetical protein
MNKKKQIKCIIWDILKKDRDESWEPLTGIEDSVNEILEICKPRKLSKEKLKKRHILCFSNILLVDFINENIDNDIWEEK